MGDVQKAYYDNGKNIMRIYTIWDKVAEETGPLYLAKNDGIAERQFLNLMQNTNVVDIFDYQLYCIGTYDNQTMFIDQFQECVLVPVNNIKVKEA